MLEKSKSHFIKIFLCYRMLSVWRYSCSAVDIFYFGHLSFDSFTANLMKYTIFETRRCLTMIIQLCIT